MDRKEAYAVLNRFKNWNSSQKSIGYAFGGPRSDSDDIYDARRALIKKAYAVLNSDEPNTGDKG